MKAFTIENNGDNTNLVYEIALDEKMDTVVFGMMNHNKIEGLVPMQYTQMNDRRFIKYNISSKVTMQQFFTGSVTKERLLKSFFSIISAINNAEEYMIELGSFIMDMEHIYIDVSLAEAELVCLPVEGFDNQMKSDTFFKNIIFSTQFDQSENCDYVAKIISYLNNGHFALSDFKKLLEELLGIGQKSAQGRQMSGQPTGPNVQRQTLYGQALQDLPAEEQMFPNQKMQGELLQIPTDASKINMVSADHQEEFLIPGMEQSIGSHSRKKKAAKEKQVKQKSIKEKESKQKQTKERRSLFGWKKSTALQVDPDVVVPGTQQSVDQVASTVSSVSQASHGANQGYAMPPQTSESFGETTVLNMSAEGETTLLGLSADEAQPSRPYLLRRKNNENIYINKPLFRLGKENSYVDYFISDNTAISRSHASIITKEGRYYIVDTNSKNHTYVNNQMLPKNTEVEICNGDSIKLANEEFEFMVQ